MLKNFGITNNKEGYDEKAILKALGFTGLTPGNKSYTFMDSCRNVIIKANPFDYIPSKGYYENNKRTINVGAVFKTSSGRLSKIIETYAFTVRESVSQDDADGNASYFYKEESISKMAEGLRGCIRALEDTRKRHPQNRGREIDHMIISTGSGGIKVFKLSL